MQEATNNTLKYAACKQITIRLGREGEQVVLRYADDGKGFDLEAARARKSLGLPNIESRAGVLGGNVDIRSAPGQGMSVEVRLPRVWPEMVVKS